jgi:3'-phosphoadenosine 5'-phosphosulfate sulfotransferase
LPSAKGHARFALSRERLRRALLVVFALGRDIKDQDSELIEALPWPSFIMGRKTYQNISLS